MQLARDVAFLQGLGHHVVIVSSGAIGAGVASLRLSSAAADHPGETGDGRGRTAGPHGIVSDRRSENSDMHVGQILLTGDDFTDRTAVHECTEHHARVVRAARRSRSSTRMIPSLSMRSNSATTTTSRHSLQACSGPICSSSSAMSTACTRTIRREESGGSAHSGGGCDHPGHREARPEERQRSRDRRDGHEDSRRPAGALHRALRW